MALLGLIHIALSLTMRMEREVPHLGMCVPSYRRLYRHATIFHVVSVSAVIFNVVGARVGLSVIFIPQHIQYS